MDGGGGIARIQMCLGCGSGGKGKQREGEDFEKYMFS